MGNETETACAQAESETEQTTAEESAPAAAAASDEAQDSDDIESLRDALQEAQEQLANAEDRALRAVAEAENVRKRAERSIDSARKFALERFVADMLPAVDSFERAAQASSEASGEGAAVAAIGEGIELSLKLLLEAMQRQGIDVVDPVGVPFDPNLHEAMSMVESASAEPGSVLEVFQKGYTVNGRLARPARVIVAKEPTPKAPAEEPAEDDAKDG